jgi:hypothetical protein
MNVRGTLIGLTFVIGLATNNAFSQVRQDGKWYFPDSVRSLCLNTEQGMVATFKALIENNRKWADDGDKSDKRRLMELTEAHKRTLVDYEESWSRLGCASIIYRGEKVNR